MAPARRARPRRAANVAQRLAGPKSELPFAPHQRVEKCTGLCIEVRARQHADLADAALIGRRRASALQRVVSEVTPWTDNWLPCALWKLKSRCCEQVAELNIGFEVRAEVVLNVALTLPFNSSLPAAARKSTRGWRSS